MLILAGIVLCLGKASPQAPAEPVFTIVVEQSGSAYGESMQKKVTARYRPCLMWSDGYYGGLNFLEMEALGSQVRSSPEGLFQVRGSLAGLKTGEPLLFYVREKTGSGNGGCKLVTATIGDGVFKWTVTYDDGSTESGDNRREAYAPGRLHGPAGQKDAVFKRTADGGILTFADPSLQDEGRCELFGLFEGNNIPEGIGEVHTFRLTNDDLKNWKSLVKVNEKTLNGAEEGQLHIKATLYGGAGPGYARVSIDGCSQFGQGYQGKVTASGEPEGGSYEFRVEPADLMEVESSGPTAILTGSRLGRGTLYLSYTAPDGVVGESSQPVSVVALYSYNNDQPIPQIVLYDADGKLTTGSVTIPYSADPENSNELLDFVPGDANIINLIPSSASLEIKGLKTGKTTLKSHDNCGNIVGPTIEVEVVNCDDETIARLEKQRQAATESLHLNKRAAKNCQLNRICKGQR